MRFTGAALAFALLLPGCSDSSPGATDDDPADVPLLVAPAFDCAATPLRVGDVNVTLDTDAGAITVVLYGAKSPITVCNFLQYVEDDYYDGTVWHRICPGFVIQAGGLDAVGQSKPARAPIHNEGPESQLRNWKGTLSMARTSDPESATTHFFVNLIDNNRLDFDGTLAPGYAVFGNVTAGWDVVEGIAATQTVPSAQGCEGRPVPTMETTITDIRVV